MSMWSNNDNKKEKDDVWGSSSTTTDAWGSSSTTTDAWGSSDASSDKKDQPNSGGWKSNRPGQRRDGGGGGFSNKRTRPDSEKDAWGSSTTKDGWGSSSNTTDAWGSSDASSNKKDQQNPGGWGSNGTEQKWDAEGGGSSNKRTRPDSEKDAWGSSTTKDGWGSSSTTTDAWGSSNASSNKKDQSNSGGWDSHDTEQKWEAEGGGSSNKRTRPNSDAEESSNKRTRPNGDAEDRPAPFKPEELDLDEEAQLQGGGAGENFKKYNEQKVTCYPVDLISPIEEFEDIVKSPLLLSNIKSQHYSAMTPIQKWAMPAIMDGHDLIGCAQTGSGKTAAFLLPVLQTLISSELESHDPNSDCQNPYCLILSPTRELANQIHVHAMMLSKDSIIKCHVIYGQVSTIHLKSKLSTGCHVLVACPGRLKDFVQRGWIGFKNIRYIILDEGDRLVDEGFTADIQNFFDHETMPPKEKRQTLFFSATFQQQTQMNAKKYLKDEMVFLTVGRIGAANEDIKQEFLCVSRQDKKRELKKILDGVPEGDKTIVFTQTKSAADMLASFFSAMNLSSTSIHGDRHQSQREQAIKAFRRGEKRFLISSPVGNRGLDLPKVALVINYDLPTNIDEYVHRIGRTGRAGHIGRAISFYDEQRDSELLKNLLEILKEAKQEIPDWMQGNSAQNDDWGTTAENPVSTEVNTGTETIEDCW